MPHYVVEPKAEHEASALRIVDAKNQARALAHVVEDTLVVRIAEPQDFMKLARDGREIEKAP